MAWPARMQGAEPENPSSQAIRPPACGAAGVGLVVGPRGCHHMKCTTHTPSASLVAAPLRARRGAQGERERNSRAEATAAGSKTVPPCAPLAGAARPSGAGGRPTTQAGVFGGGAIWFVPGRNKTISTGTRNSAAAGANRVAGRTAAPPPAMALAARPRRATAAGASRPGVLGYGAHTPAAPRLQHEKGCAAPREHSLNKFVMKGQNKPRRWLPDGC